MKRLLAITLGVALALVGTVALAARDSSGTYSLSPTSPFISGTPISSSTMNTRFSDLATEITDSLSRSGKGPMLAPIKLYSGGSATVPELVWNDDANSGFYLIGSDNLGLSLGGTKRWDFATAGSTLTGNLSVSGTSTLTGDTTVGGTLDVTGNTTVTGTLTATGKIDRPSLPTVGQQVSASSGAFSTAAGTWVDATNLSVTITTTGRPVLLMVQADGNDTVGQDAAFEAAASGVLRLVRDATAIGRHKVYTSGTGLAVPPALMLLDTPAAGTYTYKLQAVAAAGTVYVSYCKLVAYEL